MEKLLLEKLSRWSFISHSLQRMFSRPEIILVTLFWTFSNFPTSFLKCGHRNWSQYFSKEPAKTECIGSTWLFPTQNDICNSHSHSRSQFSQVFFGGEGYHHCNFGEKDPQNFNCELLALIWGITSSLVSGVIKWNTCYRSHTNIFNKSVANISNNLKALYFISGDLSFSWKEGKKVAEIKR